MDNIYQEYLKLQKIIKDTIKYIEENQEKIRLGENSVDCETIYSRPIIETENVLKLLRGKDEQNRRV